jgi:putative tryptophan/tyrosine transport system substrate-binding protein
MRRRDLLLVMSGAATMARTLAAQPRPVSVIGHISMYSATDFAAFVAALGEGLSETGYVEGQNLLVEHR